MKDLSNYNRYAALISLDDTLLTYISDCIAKNNYTVEHIDVKREYVNITGEKMTSREIADLNKKESYFLSDGYELDSYAIKLIVELFQFYLHKKTVSKVDKIKHQIQKMNTIKYQFQKELTLFSKAWIDGLIDKDQAKHTKKKTLHSVEEKYYEMTAIAFLEHDSAYQQRIKNLANYSNKAETKTNKEDLKPNKITILNTPETNQENFDDEETIDTTKECIKKE